MPRCRVVQRAVLHMNRSEPLKICVRIIYIIYIYIIKWRNVSREIEHFVETHLCKLRGILRSRVLRVLCDLIKNVSPYWGGKIWPLWNSVNGSSMAVDMYATLLVDAISMRGNKWWYITRWIGQTIPRNRTQNIGVWNATSYKLCLVHRNRIINEI